MAFKEGPQPSTREAQFQRLIEAGFTHQAVAAYGGSIDVLKTILDTGVIPSYTPDNPLPYQEKLLKGGRLYYFFPIFNRIGARPKLIQNIVSRYASSSTDPITNLSAGNVRDKAAHHALAQAARVRFFKETSIKTDLPNIYSLAMEIIPQTFDRFFDETAVEQSYAGKKEIEQDADPKVTQLIKNRVKNLKPTLTACLQERGVIIWFNDGIFTNPNYRVYAGVESENEFMVVSPELISIDVTSGAEILSDADRAAIEAIKH